MLTRAFAAQRIQPRITVFRARTYTRQEENCCMLSNKVVFFTDGGETFGTEFIMQTGSSTQHVELPLVHGIADCQRTRSPRGKTMPSERE